MGWAAPRAGVRAAVAGLSLVAVAAGTAACGGSSSDGSQSVSVFHVSPGECFLPPEKVKAELTDVDRVGCSAPHTQEAYAVVRYQGADDSLTSDYPGETSLKSFADGACAQRFASYVGVDYQDSSLFFTYLLPSARSWQQAHDRKVICFITTTGGLLHRSVKGSKT